jgi:hypothetical protein
MIMAFSFAACHLSVRSGCHCLLQFRAAPTEEQGSTRERRVMDEIGAALDGCETP